MNKWAKQNDYVIENFRKTGGQVKLGSTGPFILVHTIGAKTGKQYIIPLMYVLDGERLLAVASKGGSEEHPAWYHNLKANPEVMVEVGTEIWKVRARELSGEEREQAFERAVQVFSYYGTYQQKASRVIPVLALEKISE